VIDKNLQLLSSVDVTPGPVTFPLAQVVSPAADAVRREMEGAPFALVNPGAAWPNKRWPAARFGQVAAFLYEVRQLRPYVLWGPSERALAEQVVEASGGAARVAPATTTGDLLELSRAASLMVSGDTGPLHIAGAAGAPLVAIFGPTDPLRNGPWHEADRVVSRYGACQCHYQRRCSQRRWCLEDVTVAEVTAAVQQRLGPC
jgi:heptosyltransferase-1